MRYLSRCLRCGWNKESDIIVTTFCPNCTAHLIINDTEYDNQIAEILDKLCNDNMNDLIPKELKHKGVKIRKVSANDTNDQITMFKAVDKWGHKGVWEIIENIKDPIVRLSHRKLFIKVGGQIPNRS